MPEPFTAAEVRRLAEQLCHNDVNPQEVTDELERVLEAYAVRLEQDERFASSAWTQETAGPLDLKSPEELRCFFCGVEGQRGSTGTLVFKHAPDCFYLKAQQVSVSGFML